jgi:glycosyltransferase involved in cell wall biosynthesis
MKAVLYSIIVVCLNSGENLIKTIDSIMNQDYFSYEVIVKDGMSTDGSIEKIKNKYNDSRIKIYSHYDTGIYDAMNQAIKYVKGQYLLFLNTGDCFYNEKVLSDMALNIKLNRSPDIIYGNQYHKALDTIVYSAPRINDFACYRNVPCHQTCFYSKVMFMERGYNPDYNVRADYEHFLYCYYKRKAVIRYAPVIVCEYEGEGYSETKENREKSKEQHREIVMHYMGAAKAYKYRLIMILSLAPLRTKIAENKKLSGIYNVVKKGFYKLKG